MCIAITELETLKAKHGAGARLGRMVHKSKITWWGDSLGISISIGATDVKPGDSVDKTTRPAEIGLRESTAKGGNQFVRSSSSTQEGSVS